MTDNNIRRIEKTLPDGTTYYDLAEMDEAPQAWETEKEELLEQDLPLPMMKWGEFWAEIREIKSPVAYRKAWREGTLNQKKWDVSKEMTDFYELLLTQLEKKEAPKTDFLERASQIARMRATAEELTRAELIERYFPSK